MKISHKIKKDITKNVNESKKKKLEMRLFIKYKKKT